jgi:hypothetical protein
MMYKKLQYVDVLMNIVIYEHNSIIKILTIFYFHLIMTIYENYYQSTN